MAKTFRKLTRSSVRKLQRGNKISEHSITFERLQNGDGVYSINVMVDGQRVHRVVGRESDGTTRTHAEEFVEKIRRDAREGRLNLPKGRKVALGFRGAAKLYLERLKDGGGNDLVMKERRLRIHLVPFWGNKPLASISTFDLERYKKSRIEQGAKAGTINRELACISHLFNKSMEWKWIDKRPVVIKRFKEDTGRIV